MALADEDVTPIHDLPFLDERDGCVPKHVDMESSERLSLTLDAAVASASGENGSFPSPDAFLEALASKIREKTGGGDGGDGDPPDEGPAFTPHPWSSILRKAGYGAGAIGVFLVTWYNTVNRDLDDKATHSEVVQKIDQKMVHHSDKPHPPTEIRLRKLEGEQRIIRESQIRQETIDQVQTVTLKEIRDDVRRLRVRRR